MTRQYTRAATVDSWRRIIACLRKPCGQHSHGQRGRAVWTRDARQDKTPGGSRLLFPRPVDGMKECSQECLKSLRESHSRTRGRFFRSLLRRDSHIRWSARNADAVAVVHNDVRYALLFGRNVHVETVDGQGTIKFPGPTGSNLLSSTLSA
jgi:hypothetical protein